MASLIVDMKWQSGCGLSVILHLPGQAEWLQNRVIAPISCTLKLTPCTASLLGVHQTPWWRTLIIKEGKDTLYSLDKEWGHETPTVLNFSKVHISPWFQQLSNHRHTVLHCTATLSHISVHALLVSLTVN